MPVERCAVRIESQILSGHEEPEVPMHERTEEARKKLGELNSQRGHVVALLMAVRDDRVHALFDWYTSLADEMLSLAKEARIAEQLVARWQSGGVVADLNAIVANGEEFGRSESQINEELETELKL